MTVFSKVVTGVKRRTTAHSHSSSSTANSDGGTFSSHSHTGSSSSAEGISGALGGTPGLIASHTNEGASASLANRTSRPKDASQAPVAPDLRRFSDFMNPFPAIQPGGYTKYYQAREAAASAAAASSSSSFHSSSSSSQQDQSASAVPGAGAYHSQVNGRGSQYYALPSLCELNQRPPPHGGHSTGLSSNQQARIRSPPSVTAQQQSRLGVSGRKGKKGTSSHGAGTSHGPLASIPEAGPRLDGSSHKLRVKGFDGASTAGRDGQDSAEGKGPMASLRRKKRQLLRTPSIERDFGGQNNAGEQGRLGVLSSFGGSQQDAEGEERLNALRADRRKVKVKGDLVEVRQKKGDVDSKLGRNLSASSAQSTKSSKSTKSSVSSHRSTPSSSSSCGDSSMDSHTSGSAEEELFTPDSSIELPQPPSAFACGGMYHGSYRVQGATTAVKGLSGYSGIVGRGENGIGQGLGDWEPFERPDSRSTY